MRILIRECLAEQIESRNREKLNLELNKQERLRHDLGLLHANLQKAEKFRERVENAVFPHPGDPFETQGLTLDNIRMYVMDYLKDLDRLGIKA